MTIATADATFTYAGLGRRIVAFVFDFLIIAGYLLILIAVGISLNIITGGLSLLESPIAMNTLSFFTLVLAVILYFALQEASPQQATWGKQRAKIKAVTVQINRMSYWQSALRSAVKFISWQLAHTCVIYIWFGSQSLLFLVGALLAQALVIVFVICLWFSKRHQAPYDWLAGTIIITID